MTPFGSGKVSGTCTEQRATVQLPGPNGQPGTQPVVLDIKHCIRESVPEERLLR